MADLAPAKAHRTYTDGQYTAQAYILSSYCCGCCCGCCCCFVRCDLFPNSFSLVPSIFSCISFSSAEGPLCLLDQGSLRHLLGGSRRGPVLPLHGPRLRPRTATVRRTPRRQSGARLSVPRPKDRHTHTYRDTQAQLRKQQRCRAPGCVFVVFGLPCKRDRFPQRTLVSFAQYPVSGH